jgi:ribosomal protein L7/L12
MIEFVQAWMPLLISILALGVALNAKKQLNTTQNTQTEQNKKLDEIELSKVTEMALSGDKVGAMKLYRQSTNNGLKDSKAFVEQLILDNK